MPCAARELCALPNLTPKPHDGHRCWGECGGRLHGICGEVEDPESDNPLHRICPRCLRTRAIRKRKADDTRSRGQGQQQQSKNHESPADGKKTRTQLNHGQKFEMLRLLTQKVSHAEVARRFKCSVRTVSNVAQKRAVLEAEAASAARDDAATRKRGAAFPDVDKLVVAFVNEAKKQGLPVTRGTIMTFGHSAKETILDANNPKMTAMDKEKLGGFLASEKWAKNFVIRNRLNGKVAPNTTIAHSNAADQQVGMEENLEAHANHESDSHVLDNIITIAGNNMLAEQGGGGGAACALDTSGEPGQMMSPRRQVNSSVNQSLSETTTPAEERQEPRRAPRPFSELAPHFRVLEDFAESCGIDDAAESLRKAKSAFVKARSSWLAWKAGEMEQQGGGI